MELNEFIFEGIKGIKKRITLVLLTTKLGSKGKYADTVAKMKKICDKRGIRCIIIDAESGRIDKTPDGSFYISNKGEISQEVFVNDTVVLARRSAIVTNVSRNFFKKLEDFGFTCINSLSASLLCEDKFQTILKMQENDVPAPRTALISDISDVDSAVQEIGGKYPVVCKYLSGTKGIGVFTIDSRESLVSTLQAIWVQTKNMEILVQEKIDADFDLRIHVIVENSRTSKDYQILGVMKRLRIKGDFRTNYSLGGQTETYEISPEIEEIAIEAAKATGCLWCGVDIIIDKFTGKPYVLEVNASPGTDGIESTTGINVTSKIVDFLINKRNWIKPKKNSGFREVFRIKEIGKFVGKLDTGNGSKSCSMHGDEMEVEGSDLRWKIGGKSYRAPIIGYSNAEVGASIENRPIVELDIFFKGNLYKGIKFSMVDRNNKSTPLLLNRDFMSDAGIIVDPSEDFIMTKKIKGYTPLDCKEDIYKGISLE